MRVKNPGLALLEERVAKLVSGVRSERELSQLLIEHKIAMLRKRQAITQAELARLPGVSQPMIAQIESGTLYNLTLKTLIRTARVLWAKLKIDLVSSGRAR